MASLFPREIYSPSSRRLQGSWKAELQRYDAVHRPFLPLSLLRAAETSFPTNQDKIWTWGLILTAAQQAGGGGLAAPAHSCLGCAAPGAVSVFGLPLLEGPLRHLTTSVLFEMCMPALQTAL